MFLYALGKRLREIFSTYNLNREMKNLRYFTMAALAAITLTSCEKTEETIDPVNSNEQKGSFTLEFEHRFDGSNLMLNQNYTNGSGEDLTFNKVRYYVSNIILEKMDGTMWMEEESYHLVDVSELSSLEIKLENVPAGEYHKLSYMIGVDSLRNISGAQDGALSPNNDMFWSWNSGYIFAKFEGTSSASGSGNFTYHIGGFKGENKAMITKTFDLHSQILKLNPTASTQVHMIVDLKKLFDGMHKVSISTMPNMTMPGMMALHLAHNFGAGIALDHIHE